MYQTQLSTRLNPLGPGGFFPPPHDRNPVTGPAAARTEIFVLKERKIGRWGNERRNAANAVAFRAGPPDSEVVILCNT